MKLHLSNCPDNLLTIVCEHVFEDTRPVRLVVCEEDGTLLMLCGEADHSEDASDYHGVGVGHLLERDPKLLSVPPLDKGWEAERANMEGDWKLSRI